VLRALAVSLASAQENIDWKLLSKVRFKNDYIEDFGAYYMKPKFSKAVEAYEGKEVILSGYFIPFNEQVPHCILHVSTMAGFRKDFKKLWLQLFGFFFVESVAVSPPL